VAIESTPTQPAEVRVLPPGLDLEAHLAAIRAREGFHRLDVDGDRLLLMPPANPWSSYVGMRLGISLGGHISRDGLPLELFGADAGWLLTAEPLPYGRRVTPDLSVVRRERLPQGAPPAGFWPVVPDLAVEVLSPSDHWPETERKLALYRRAGAPLVWVLDPRAGTAFVYARGQLLHEWLRERGDRLQAPDLVPGWGLSLRDLLAGWSTG